MLQIVVNRLSKQTNLCLQERYVGRMMYASLEERKSHFLNYIVKEKSIQFNTGGKK